MTDDWIKEFGPYFWLSLCGLIIGCSHFTIRACGRSNCAKVKCLGVTFFEREIDPNIPPLVRTLSDSV